MNFTASEDIDAPIEAVFGEVTDFAAFERSARKRGAEVQRTDTPGEPGAQGSKGAGPSWHARFMLRDRPREIDIAVASQDPPNGLVLEGWSQAITAGMRIDLVALSPTRTRLGVDLTITPKGIAGRVMVHPLKLMHANLSRRFRLRVAAFAMDAETRLNNSA